MFVLYWTRNLCTLVSLLKILHLSYDRGADASKTTNSEDIEMKTNLVDKKGDPNYVEEAGPWIQSEIHDCII